MLRLLASSLLCLGLLAGCASSSATPSPSLPPSPASATLPVHGSAREMGERVLMAPGPGGTLFASIPRPGGSVLALLDRSGRSHPGWPITVNDSTECGLLLPLEDGSVRVVCTLENPDGNMFSPMGAFAFDSNGRLLGGWPVDLQGYAFTGRVVGDELTLFAGSSLGDVIAEGKPSEEGGLVTVAADGAIRSGARAPMFETCCRWAVGPDGIAYGVASVSGPDEGSEEVSRITALDLSGERAGWPVSFDGTPSGPAFGPGGRIVLTVASLVRSTSRVLVFDRDGKAALATSTDLPIATAEYATAGGCSADTPRSPLVAQDGTIFVFSELDTAVFAVDPLLKVVRGWPYRPAEPLVRRDSRYVKEDAYCPSLAIPAVGPDSVLYMPLQARDTTVGGSIVAVGPDGRVRPGWPVELRRPGAEFWSVVVGSDGTAYALAIEPETGDSSSASILAIAPDSTVLYTTTIIEP